MYPTGQELRTLAKNLGTVDRRLVEAAADELLALRSAASALYAEYEQLQIADNHPAHRPMWEDLGRALGRL